MGRLSASFDRCIVGSDGEVEKARIMPQPYSFYPTERPIPQRHCPTCHLPMFLSRIEPGNEPDHDMRTFVCLTCKYTETVSIKFR